MPFKELPRLYSDENDQGATKTKARTNKQNPQLT